ncbi:MAG TPA: ACP S-malonyltransferase [Polyangiaceae bacterium]|nr:ACP S-malonyltransferase [Polyangiaceae bacterium]
MIAWLFPGQGTQTVGMGKSLCAASPAARAVFEAADRALGERFTELVFEGPLEKLTYTANAQPAILTASMAALAALREAAPALPLPYAAAGHSLGEYSALVAAGALAFEQAVQLVRLRGEAMQRAVAAGEGAMAAIMGSDPGAVEQLCADVRAELVGRVVSPATFNAPGQIVIAGHADAVARAASLGKERKLKAIPLKVSAPFHCSLMAPAAEVLDRALAEVRFGPLGFPVVSNVDASANRDSAKIRSLLVRQVAGAVRWQESLQWMAAQGVSAALEIGPGNVLAGLAKRGVPSLVVSPAFEASEISAVAQRGRA